MTVPQCDAWILQQHPVVSWYLFVEVREQGDVDVAQTSSLTKQHEIIHIITTHPHDNNNAFYMISALKMSLNTIDTPSSQSVSNLLTTLHPHQRRNVLNLAPCVCGWIIIKWGERTLRGVLIHAKWVKWESMDTPTTSQLTSWNSVALSLKEMISVGHTKVLQ